MTNYVFLQKPYYSICIDKFSPHCGFFDGNWDYFLCESLVTQVAMTLFLPSVNSLMFIMPFLYCESIIPLAALILFIMSVTFLCTLRCPLGAKSLVTFAAMIWALCWRNMLVHTMLAYDNSILIEFYCLKRSHFLEKALSQILHWYGLASVWDLLCNKMLQFLEKVRPQNGIDISLVEFQ